MNLGLSGAADASLTTHLPVLDFASLHRCRAFRPWVCNRVHDGRLFAYEKVSAQPRRLLCARARFHRDAVIGEGILQGERPDTGLRGCVTNESGDFLLLDVTADDSPVILRCLGVQDIVREGFQELPPKFAQIPDGLLCSAIIRGGRLSVNRETRECAV
jgi:hypothetical protein